MAELAKISDESFAALLGSIGSDAPPALDMWRVRLREHVALLSSFDASSLPANPDGTSKDVVLSDFLLKDCQRVSTRTGQRWCLRPNVRVEVLAAIDSSGRLAELFCPPYDADLGCQMASMYIAGTAPALTEQTVDQLQATALVAEWLSGTRVVTPTPEEAQGQLAIATILEPLRTLVSHGFVGRRRELQELSDYAEVLPPSNLIGATVRHLRRILRFSEKPPLVIHGPGGVGKSTLIARFVLDHVDADHDRRFPFAYLSFDRPELSIEQPLTLLAEAATQLGALYPTVTADTSAFAQSVRSTVAASLASSSDRRAARGTWSSSFERTQNDEYVLVDRFAALIEQANGRNDLPNLWVLDVFEVAQRQGPVAVERLWGFLERLQAACPRLRVVFAGRAPLESHTTQQLALGDLDPESALQLLHMQLQDLALPDDFLVSIARAVSAHPVSLRLAALLVRSEAARGLDTESRRRELLFLLRGNEVQGVLYRRILDHLDNPDLRKLAHPGLVVRRVTPDVIQNVLAVPCGIRDVDEERAQELFNLLSREVALVRSDGDNSLRQRSDVRRVMLGMMKHENLSLMQTLQRRALRYYKNQSTFLARVEELYYRLALGQSSETLDDRFDLDAARELEGDLEEFPPASQVYLASRLGLSVDPEVLQEADDLSWARQAAQTARRLLDAGEAAKALPLVTSRQNDTVIPYTAALEVEALAALQQHEQALARVADHLSWATTHGKAHAFIDVGLVGARIAEDRGDFEQALAWLRDIDTSAAAVNDRVAQFSAKVAIVRIYRRSGIEGNEAVAVRAALIDNITDLNAHDRSRNPGLVRDLAAEIGDAVPTLAPDALRLGGTELPAPKPPSKRSRRRQVPKRTTTEQGKDMSEAIVRVSDSDRYLREAVKTAFQEESDKPSF